MSELLEQCLDHSRSGNRNLEISDLRDIVAGAVNRIAISAELQSVDVEQDIPECVSLTMDRRRIQRVLVTLMVNALEAMPHGGIITVSAVAGRRSVLIRIRDTGPGIAPEIKDRLFQPYATAGKPNGVGLGLAFSRRVVIEHGGEIWAKSTPRGACFVMRLPRTNAKRTASR
jgi:signal transduction histidine kinase